MDRHRDHRTRDTCSNRLHSVDTLHTRVYITNNVAAFMQCFQKFGYPQKIRTISRSPGIVPDFRRNKFRHGESIVAMCCQLTNSSANAQCDKLATIVGRTELTMLATVDVECSNSSNASRFIIAAQFHSRTN